MKTSEVTTSETCYPNRPKNGNVFAHAIVGSYLRYYKSYNNKTYLHIKARHASLNHRSYHVDNLFYPNFNISEEYGENCRSYDPQE